MLSKVSDSGKMESASAKIEMLRGEENWLQWRFVMRTLLEEDGDLINVCEGNLRHPGNSAEKEIARERFLKADRLARKLIVTSIGRKPLDLLLSCTTAHDMWKKLNAVYDMKSDENLNIVQKQFFDFKWEESENVSHNLSKLELIAAKMKALGSEIGEKMLISRILSVLPNKFNHFHSAWDSVEEEKKTLDRLSIRLMTEEIRWKKNDQKTSVALVTRGNNYRRERQKQSSKREYEKQGPSCFNCGKVGHLKKDCFRCFICKRKGHTSKNCFKNNKENNSRDDQEPRNQNRNHSEIGLLESTSTIQAANHDVWIFDSEATDHMTGQQEWFSVLEKFDNTVKIEIFKYMLRVENTTALKLMQNAEFHQRSKHIDVKYHFLRDLYNRSEVDVTNVTSEEQLTDICTKALPKPRFEYLRQNTTSGLSSFLKHRSRRQRIGNRLRRRQTIDSRQATMSTYNYILLLKIIFLLVLILLY